jgi:hypothetical protein
MKICTKQIGDFGIEYFSKADTMGDMQKQNKYTKRFCNNIEIVETTTNKIEK